MLPFNKALRVASRLARGADVAEVGALIRKSLAETDMTRHGIAAGVLADTLCCLAPRGLLNRTEALAGLRSQPLTAGAMRRFDGTSGADAQRTAAQSHKGASGSRSYTVFTPTQAPTRLLILLHGCSQTAADFALGTRMNTIAEANGVAVVYPEQSRGANAAGCWNWFDPKDQYRDVGEPAILAGITREVAARFGIGPSRTFVAGLSAGGAMAAILAETYPDLYAGVGIHSGLAYGSANDMPSAFLVMNGRGNRVFGEDRRARDIKARRPVPAIILHGEADRTVHPGNADAIVARLVGDGTDLDTVTERGVSGGRRYARTVGTNGNGAMQFESWRIEGAGHAWSGGSPQGSYTDPAGPDASAEMMRFFMAFGPLEQAA